MDEPLDNPKLENQICFPLYVCAKEVVRLYAPLLESLGLTYTQYIAMMVLWQHKGITAKQMGQILYLDSGTLTPVLKRLEEKGWVTRCRCQDDERNLWVCLTPEGEAIKENASQIPSRIAEQIAMSPQDSAELHRLLHKLIYQLGTI